MEIRINHYVSPEAYVDEQDSKNLAAALNRLGYYDPDEKTGLVPFDPDHRLFTALRKFQNDHGIFGSGALHPGDQTVQALNDAIAAQEKSSERYTWRCVRDGKARSTHAARDGHAFVWNHPPPGGNPGEDYNCRCWVETTPGKNIYPDAIKPVYPELILLSLAGTSRLYSLWRVWINAKNSAWALGEKKSAVTWNNQIRDRNWTPEEITETILKGKKHEAPNKVNPENTATRYVYKKRFIVRDDKTKEILQISDKNFKPNLKDR